MIKRKQDWPIRLEGVITKARNKKFKYGYHDCALFTARCVKAMTGQDFYKAFRGQYSGEDSAKDALKLHGSGTLRRTVTKFLGKPLKSPLKASRGDVVLVKTHQGQAIGVVDLSGSKFVAVSPDGISFNPLTQAIAAWRV